MTVRAERGEATTIAALATAPYPSGLAVIRISGPRTRTALLAIFQSKKDPVKLPRTLVFGDLTDYRSGQVIDNALAVFMPGPHSFTGEDVAEFQFHGSPLLVQKILRSLFAFGVTPAEPGEFTLRAFLNGKMDLVQAEAVSELINATSDQALKIAGDHLKGRFSSALDELGEPLRNTLAELEASIDFPEEEIKPESRASLRNSLLLVKDAAQEILRTYAYGHVVRDGFKVLLCGRPNVGKSSLLNLLLKKERAIVSPISGTTRDIIEEQAILGGHRFVFCDSAGIRETSDEIEKMGVELARERVEWADLILMVVDATDPASNWQALADELREKGARIWMVVNKIDANPAAIGALFCDSAVCAQNFYISVKTSSGVDALVAALVDEVASSLPDSAHASNVLTNERQFSCLERAEQAVSRAIQGLENKNPLEIISDDVRQGLTALEEMVGKTYTEDILGRIFSKFCIGK
jgi:tRNA modification GTPase